MEDRLTTEEVPVPERLMICGLLLALLVNVIEAERAPVPEGVKATLILQLDPAATEPPHVSLSLKSPEFVPATGMGGV